MREPPQTVLPLNIAMVSFLVSARTCRQSYTPWQWMVKTAGRGPCYLVTDVGDLYIGLPATCDYSSHKQGEKQEEGDTYPQTSPKPIPSRVLFFLLVLPEQLRQ